MLHQYLAGQPAEQSSPGEELTVLQNAIALAGEAAEQEDLQTGGRNSVLQEPAPMEIDVGNVGGVLQLQQ